MIERTLRPFGAPFVLLLSACTVGPDYVRPAVPLAPGYLAVSAASVDAVPADLATWWTAANDPMLNALVARALAGNLDLEQASARIDQAGATLGLARAALLPSGEINASYTRLYDSLAAAPGAFLRDVPGGYPRNQNNYLLNGAASWEIDLFGGTRRANEAARASLGAAVADRQAVRVSVVATLADLYVQLRRAQSDRTLNDRQIVLQRRDLVLTRLLADRGLIARADLDRAVGALADSDTRAPIIETSEAALLNAIDVLLGDPPGTNTARLSARRDLPEMTAVPMPGAPVDLLRRRPDVLAAEARLRSGNARIGQAMAEYYPKISLSGLFGVASLAAGNLFSSDGLTARGAVGLRWRLFDFKRIDAEIDQARELTREQLAAYRASVLGAAQDVEDSFARVASSQAIVAERTRAFQAQDRAKSSVLVAFRRGSISERDRIVADQAVLAADLALVGARAERTRAVIQLYRALGGGWASDLSA